MIIGPCFAVTGGPEPRVLEAAGVRVVDAHIAQVGPIAGLASAHPEETVWPARGRLLLPGRVDAHAHLSRQLARGLGLRGEDWERYERALCPEDVFWASMAALAECARHGITTVFDLHRSPACLDLSLSEIAAAAGKSGLRVATAYAMDDRDSPSERAAAVEESLGLAADLERRGEGRLCALVGARASSLEGLGRVLLESEERRGRRALHLELGLDATPGARWRDRLASSPILWAHAERAPLSLQVEARARGDLRCVSGRCPGALARDPELAWGSDAGPHAAPAPESPPESRTGFPLPEISETFARRLHWTAARWAAPIFGASLGVLRPGAPADLILLDYHPPTAVDPETLSCHMEGIVRAPVSGVMVAGEIVMDHGVLVRVDEGEIAARSREQASRLWRRMGVGAPAFALAAGSAA